MLGLLERHWVAGAGFMALALLAPLLLVAEHWPSWLVLLYLHSPGYMIHQVEEHVDDRFRAFVNERVFGGVEALTTFDVIWINVGCVWCINLAALYLGRAFGPGYALVAPYLMLINGSAHIASVLRFGGYNPGLITTIMILLPLSGAALWLMPGSAMQHGVAVATAVGLHGLIAFVAFSRARIAVRRTAA